MKKLLVLIILIAPWSCWCKTMDAFAINGTVVSDRLFNRMWQEANVQQPITRKDYQQRLIDSMVLAEYALTHYPKLNQPSRVGFDPQLTQQLQVNQLLLRWFKFDDAKRQKAAHTQLELNLTAAELNDIIGQPGILGYELAPRQRLLAEAKTVATIAIAGEPTIAISLAQLFDSQSVQGKMAFYQGDLKPLKKMIFDRFLLLWHRAESVKRADFDRNDLQVLDRIVQARYHEPLLMLEMGAISAEHGDNDGLEPFKAQVTGEQIKAFYQQHLADFSYISAAKARLLSFPDQVSAVAARKQINQGKPWPEIAKSLGQSGWFPDSNEGWLESKDAKGWLPTLAFTFNLGECSPVIRSPQGKWHLVWVEQRRNDIYPLQSETVAFQATNAIAQQLAQQAFVSLKQDLLAKATVTHYE